MYSSRERTALLRIIAQYNGDELRQAITDQNRLEAAIKDTLQDLARYDDQVRNVRQGIESLGASIRGDALDEFSRFGTYLQTAEKQGGELTQQLRTLVRAFEEIGGELDPATFNRYQMALSTFNSEAIEGETAVDRLRRALEEMGTEIIQSDDHMRQAEAELSEYNEELREGEDRLERYRDELDNSRLALQRQEDALGRNRQELRAHDQALQTTGQKVKDTFEYVTASLVGATTFYIFNTLEDAVRAIKDFVQDATELWTQYDFMVRQIFAQTPELSSSVRGQIEAATTEAAAQLGYLPSKIIPTVRKALNLGLDEANLFSDITQAAKSARISGEELEGTLVTAVQTVNAYGQGLYNVTEVLDYMAYITQNSVLEQQDLNQGWSAIVNTAAEAGVALDEVAAAVVTMSNQGDDWQEIMSLLTNMLVQINISGTSLGKVFKEAAGVEFSQFVSQGGSLVEAMILIDEHAKKAGQSVQSMVGGDSNFYRDFQAARGAMELTGRHIQELQVNSAQAANSFGLLDEAMNTMEGSSEMVIAQNMAQVESFKLLVGEALEPTTKNLWELKGAMAEFASGTLSRHIDWAAEQSAFQEAFGGDVFQQNKQRIFDMRDAFQELAEQGRITGDQYSVTFDIFERFSGTTWWGANIFERDIIAARNYAEALEALYTILEDNPDILPEDAFAEVLRIAEAGWVISESSYNEAEKSIVLWDMFQEGIKGISEEAETEAENFVRAFERIAAGTKEIVDADTFKMLFDGEIVDIRLAGVDAPETPKEWSDFYLEQLGMPHGQEAVELVTNLLMNGDVTLGPQLGESFDRQVREVFVDGKRLSTILAEEGLAIPMLMDIDDEQVKIEITRAVREAAKAGKGIFENEEIQAAWLKQQITTMEEIKEFWPELEVASAAYTDILFSQEEALTNVLEAMKALGDPDNKKSLAEEQKELAQTQEELIAYYKEYAVEAVLANTQATDSTLNLMLAMGLITEEELETRQAYASMIENIDMMTTSLGFARLEYEYQAQAITYLTEGLYDNAEAAIRAATANQRYNEIVSQVGDNELADKMFRAEVLEGATTTPPVVVTMDLDYTTLFQPKYEDVLIEIEGFTDKVHTGTFDSNADEEALKVENLHDWTTKWEEQPFNGVFESNSEETTTKVQRLIEKSQEWDGSVFNAYYHQWVIKHVTGDDPDPDTIPSGASGGIVSEGRYFYVGEFGPEYAYLPAGTHLTPHDQLPKSTSINMQFSLDSGESPAEAMSREMIRALRKVNLI